MVPTRPFSLNVRHEWRTAGGFHALCHEAHQSPQVTAMVKRRVWCGDPPDSFWGPLAHQWIWLRSRWQGIAHQPMRWMVSWMLSSVWDRKFCHDTPLTAALSSLAWQAENHDSEDVLIIQRFWVVHGGLSRSVGHGRTACRPLAQSTHVRLGGLGCLCLPVIGYECGHGSHGAYCPSRSCAGAGRDALACIATSVARETASRGCKRRVLADVLIEAIIAAASFSNLSSDY